MKKKLSRILALALAFLMVFSGSALAHPGRTDSSGGHRDNKNKSGLGSYHYHCGGHPAHLHDGGVCPYAKDSSKSSADPAELRVSKIKLTAPTQSPAAGTVMHIDSAITPQSAAVQALEWSSSNEDVALPLGDGNVLLLGPGKCKLTARAPDGSKSSASVTLNVKKASAPADRAALLAQLPAGFAITGRSGSSAILFAQENELPFTLTYPDGLPFSMGDMGEAVKDVQVQLKKLKYFKKNTTGTYGENTEAALAAFYEAHGSVYDGEVSAEAYDWIMSAVD